MRQQSLSSKLTYDRPILLSEITSRIADRAQSSTQVYGRRPYGVGLLISGVDALGVHLFEFSPSGVTQEMVASAIGARSQMARTYLERHMGEFETCQRDDLIKHALRALKESLSQDKELTIDNTSLGVAGLQEDFIMIEGEAVAGFLETTFENRAESAEQGTAASTSTGAGTGPANTDATTATQQSAATNPEPTTNTGASTTGTEGENMEVDT